MDGIFQKFYFYIFNLIFKLPVKPIINKVIKKMWMYYYLWILAQRKTIVTLITFYFHFKAYVCIYIQGLVKYVAFIITFLPVYPKNTLFTQLCFLKYLLRYFGTIWFSCRSFSPHKIHQSLQTHLMFYFK